MDTLRLLLAPPYYNLRAFHKQILLNWLLLIRLRSNIDSITESASNWEKGQEEFQLTWLRRYNTSPQPVPIFTPTIFTTPRG